VVFIADLKILKINLLLFGRMVTTVKDKEVKITFGYYIYVGLRKEFLSQTSKL